MRRVIDFTNKRTGHLTKEWCQKDDESGTYEAYFITWHNQIKQSWSAALRESIEYSVS